MSFVVLLFFCAAALSCEGVLFPEHSYAMLDPSLAALPGPEKLLSRDVHADAEREASSATHHMNPTGEEQLVSVMHPTVFETSTQNAYLRNFGLVRQRVLGDGNCLFRSISQVLLGTEDSHVDLRSTAAEYMRNNLEMFRPFFLSNDAENSDQQILHEINTLSQNGVYAGQESVIALSQALGVNILVTHGGTVEDPRVFTMQHHSVEQSDITLHVVFSNLGGGHYDAVVDHQNLDTIPVVDSDVLEEQIHRVFEADTNTIKRVWSETKFSNFFSFSDSKDDMQKPIKTNDKKFFCDSCRKTFVDRSSLKRHIIKKHPEQGLSVKSRSKYNSCMISSCSCKFRTVKELLSHLQSYHGAILEKTIELFSDIQEFLTWKENEEISNNVFFKKERPESKRRRKVSYQYVCNRNGNKICHDRKYQKTTSRNRRGNLKGSCKINSFCPSRMYVSADKTSGEVKVIYYQTHSHSVAFDQTKYLPMPQHLRESISRKLSLGIPVDVILDDIQSNVGNLAGRSSDDIQYFQLVNRQNIMAMKRKISDCKYKRHERDEISTLMWVKELQTNPSVNPVLFFKQQGIKDKSMPLLLKEDFMLVLMTNEQTDIYRKFGSRVICMDSTHKTNQYDFKLITLLVVDEYHKGYPVAFCISNREDASALEYFLNSVKSRSPNTNINILLTDDDLAGISAARAVFGNQLSHHLCVWHVLQAWRRKLQSMVPNKDHRVEIFFFLHTLLNSKTDNEFNIYLQQFTSKYSTLEASFFKYFHVNYLSRKEKWALHLRPKDLQTEITTNMFLESFHNKLKTIYFDRKQNKRLDKLISVLLDMEKHYYLHRIKYTTYNKPEDFNLPYISACHSASHEIANDHISQINENQYTIKSSKTSVSPYTVTRLSSSCNLESCYQKCKILPCVNLCSHMYSCSCPDVHSLCKHIHKIHSNTNSNYSTITPDSNSEDMVHTKVSNQDLQEKKNERLLLKYHQAINTITEQLNDPSIQSTRLESIVSDLEKIITSNKAAKSLTPPAKMDPKFKVAANQHFEKQPKFKSTQKPKKRQNKQLKAPSSDDKARLLNQNLPQTREPSNTGPSVAPYPPIVRVHGPPAVNHHLTPDSADPIIARDGGISIHPDYRIPPNTLNRPLTVKLPSGKTMTIVTLQPSDTISNSKSE